MLRCGACRSEMTEEQARLDACPLCGDDGYTDWRAHQPRLRPARPVYDDSGAADLRELAQERD